MSDRESQPAEAFPANVDTQLKSGKELKDFQAEIVDLEMRLAQLRTDFLEQEGENVNRALTQIHEGLHALKEVVSEESE